MNYYSKALNQQLVWKKLKVNNPTLKNEKPQKINIISYK